MSMSPLAPVTKRNATSKRPFFPFWWHDYLAQVANLSPAECGAYTLLMVSYWANKGLPDDKEQLARITKMTPREWAKASPKLAHLFGPGWSSHSMLDTDLQRAAEISDARRAAVTAREAKRSDWRLTVVASNDGSIDASKLRSPDDPLHTTHSTQGSNPGEGLPLENPYRRYSAAREDEPDHDGEDVFGSRGAA